MRVSVIFLGYNHKRFAERALKSVLQQTYQPLEILVSDDSSPDNAYEIVSRVVMQYRGPHQLILRRNKTTCGVAHHLSICMKEVTGELIVVAHSDDVSLPERVEKVVEHFSQEGEQAMAAFSDFVEIDAHDKVIREVTVKVKPIDWKKPRIPGNPPGGVMAFRRAVFDVFGEIHQDVGGAEDDVIFFRGNLLGYATRIPEKLVLKRVHEANASALPAKRDLAWYRQKYQVRLAVWAQRLQDLNTWCSLNPLYAPRFERALRYICNKIKECNAYLAIARHEHKKLIPAMKQLAIQRGNLLRAVKLYLLARKEVARV